jgi:DnaJ-class molecular chaperone
MPVHESSGDFGDLYVKVTIQIPTVLSEKQILIAKKLFAMRNFW